MAQCLALVETIWGIGPRAHPSRWLGWAAHPSHPMAPFRRPPVSASAGIPSSASFRHTPSLASRAPVPQLLLAQCSMLAGPAPAPAPVRAGFGFGLIWDPSKQVHLNRETRTTTITAATLLLPARRHARVSAAPCAVGPDKGARSCYS
ncbi:hypothetical protein Purlil1_7603 [Purpureocillium lilacinum]|uniref:Uncharacterized protein n=1 Tax=Purpureocillium lilacinum TaxID=33203 RepID=A0ABR0BVJ5_PURLI|nr:hypothetical protein Purlil1_7603 [Purpureocillium lilacinum]